MGVIDDPRRKFNIRPSHIRDTFPIDVPNKISKLSLDITKENFSSLIEIFCNSRKTIFDIMDYDFP